MLDFGHAEPDLETKSLKQFSIKIAQICEEEFVSKNKCMQKYKENYEMKCS